MSVMRHCDFYPTPRGWYMNLATNEHATLRDSATYGPTPTLYEAQLHLRGFAEPGGYQVSHKLRPAPQQAPNGSAIHPVRFYLEAPGRMGLRGIPDRFIATREDEGIFLYDTATCLCFSVDADGRVTRVEPRHFWQCAPAFVDMDVPVPSTEAGWLGLVKGVVGRFPKGGVTFFPVVLPGLERQPISAMEMAVL